MIKIAMHEKYILLLIENDFSFWIYECGMI